MAIEIKEAADLGKVLDRFDGTLTDHDKRLKEIGEGMGALKNAGDQIGALDRSLAEVKEQVKAGFRRYQGGETEREPLTVTREDFQKFGMGVLHKAPTKVDRIGQFDYATPESVIARHQDLCDELYILKSNLKLTDTEVRQTAFYKNTYRPHFERTLALFKEAFDTLDAGAGLEWIPSEFSTRLIEKVRLELNVVALFDTFDMPRSPYSFPVWLNDLSAYTFSENTSNTGQTAIDDGIGSTTVTSNRTWTAVGLGCQAYSSRFFQEDSIVEVLPFLNRAVVQALRNSLETAVINGDTTATHQDNDIAAVTRHAAKAWIGLRKAARSSTATVDMSGAKVDTRTNFMAGPMRARTLMGVYGANVNDLAWIVSTGGAVQALQVESFDTAASLVAGSGTNVNGNLQFKPYGMTYVVSEFMKENLAATGVNTSGGPNTFTGQIVVNRRAWMLGNLRNITIEVLREIAAQYDQDVVLVKWRGAFNSPFGTASPHTAYIYDIGL